MSTQTNTVFDIDGIDVQDDLGVELNPETYQDAQPQMPLFKGIYGFRIKDMDLNRDKDGNVIFNDGYPSVSVKQIEVVEGLEKPRIVYLGRFGQRVNIKPRKRFGAKNDAPLASELADLIRSGDGSASFSGWKEALSVLQSLVAQGTVFYSKLDWEAADSKAIKAQVEAIKENAEDVNSKETRDAVNTVYKTLTRRGQTKFKAADGNGYVPFIVGEDGEQIDARVVVPMDGFISQQNRDKVKIGPSIKA